jgi:hypothetical protein
MRSIVSRGLPLILSVASLAAARPALADTVTCSNADQSLSYSRVTGNGGAWIDLSTLRYREHSAENRRPHDQGFTLALSDRRELASSPIEGGILRIAAARATGSLEAAGEWIGFDEWVVCREERFPMCHRCP